MATLPPKAAPVPKPPKLVDFVDAVPQVVLRLQTPTFFVEATITKEVFVVTGVLRRTDRLAEIWPMSSNETLEYSAAVSDIATMAPRMQAQLKVFAL